MATCTKEYNKLEEIQCQAAELSNKMKHLKEKVCEHRERKRKQFEEEIQGYEEDIKKKQSKLHHVNMQLEELEQTQGAKNAQYVTKEDVDKYNSIPIEDRVNVLNPRGRAPSTSHTYDYTKQAWVNYRKAGIMKDGRERAKQEQQKKDQTKRSAPNVKEPLTGLALWEKLKLVEQKLSLLETWEVEEARIDTLNVLWPTLSQIKRDELKTLFVGEEKHWQLLPPFNAMNPEWGKNKFLQLVNSLWHDSKLIHTTVFDNKETLIWVLLGAPEQGNVSMRIFTSKKLLRDIEERTDVLLEKKQYAKGTGSEESDDEEQEDEKMTEANKKKEDEADVAELHTYTIKFVDKLQYHNKIDWVYCHCLEGSEWFCLEGSEWFSYPSSNNNELTVMKPNDKAFQEYVEKLSNDIEEAYELPITVDLRAVLLALGESPEESDPYHLEEKYPEYLSNTSVTVKHAINGKAAAIELKDHLH